MTTRLLVSRLSSLDVKLSIDGNNLRYDAAPGVIDDAMRLAIIERHDDLVDWIKRATQDRSDLLPPIAPIDRHRIGQIPLSFAQQRLWFLEQLATTYHIASAWSLRGSLNHEALRKALQEIVQRHESLRTCFQLVNGSPTQVVMNNRRLELPVIDIAASCGDLEWDAVLQSCRAEAEIPFDLSSDLMVRAKLLRLGDEDHVLQLTIHHIASDGWSTGQLHNELSNLYEAYAENSTPTLPDLPVQYVDYTVWQRHVLDGPRLNHLLNYWRAQLEGVVPLQLPTDRPRPVVPAYRGGHCDIDIPPGVFSELKWLSQTEGVTLHMTLLAVFKCLLAKYSNQSDIAVGVPTAGRTQIELEKQIGCFINTLVIRTDLSDDPSFRGLLRRVRHLALEAYENQDLPFEKLVEDIQPKRDTSRNPLFQVLFQLLSFSGSELELKDLEVTRIEIPDRPVRFDLELHLQQLPDRIRGSLSYQSELFDHSTIQRMAGHYRALLEAIIADPDRPLSKLSCLTHSEKTILLRDWNNTNVEYPSHKCVHQLFEEQVERTPDAVAIVGANQTLTYAELNQRANQLAHRLRSLGVRPDSLVGLYVDRSPELVIGALGILKAGGAYVPLDLDSPVQRLEVVLNDTQASWVVTKCQLRDRLPTIGLPAVILDVDDSQLVDESCINPNTDVVSTDLAYVMYTSGSTGRPKGVAIEHRSISRLVFGNDYATFGADRVFLQLATISFDASTFEVWGALLHGAKLVIAPHGLPDFEELSELIDRHHVTTLWLTATLFNQIVEHAPQTLSGVKEILTGGEALSPRHIRGAQQALGPSVQLINGYGPTEGTTFSTVYRIPSMVSSDGDSIPIGRPLGNTQVFVLDERRNLVPTGVVGELYIGGVGLARHYLNRPELTAEKFVANPFSVDPRSRLYRTGDWCRWREDGNLEFVGRRDHQVKLRGYRIELGEVEAALREVEGVAESVVTQWDDPRGDKQLVAYWTATASPTTNASEIRTQLANRLPHYMVPAVMMKMASLPQTQTGKIDRERLPEPAYQTPKMDDGRVQPRTPEEQLLAKIWNSLLSVDEIGIRDNFFDLGGHSLLVSRLVAEIHARTGKQVSFGAIFQSPTIEQLAEVLQRSSQPKDLTSLVPIRTDGTEPPIFWVHGPAKTCPVMLKRFSNRPIHLFRALEYDGANRAMTNIEQTAEYYLQEMDSLELSGPVVLGGFSVGAVIAYEMSRQMHQKGREVELVFMLDPTPLNSQIQSLPDTPKNDDAPIVLTPAPSRELLSDRIRRHVSHVLRGSSRWRYILLRIRGLASKQFNRLRASRLALSVCRSLVACGLTVPKRLRENFRSHCFLSAMELYEAHSIPQDVIIFQTPQTSKRGLEKGTWKDFASVLCVIPEIAHSEWANEEYFSQALDVVDRQLVQQRDLTLRT